MLTALSAPPSPQSADRNAVTASFADGEAGILLDHGGAVLAFPAATATTAQLHFAIRHSSGLIHAAMPSDLLDRLRIPDQWRLPSEDSGTGFTVAVDASTGITTGISAHDRAHTVRILADPTTTSQDLTRPGHVMPIRCAPGGFAVKPRPWELAIDLVAAAGYPPVAVVCRLIGNDGDTMHDHCARAFAVHHDLPLVGALRPQINGRRHLKIAGGVEHV